MAGIEEDLYLVLGLEQGLESTAAEVKKAYRKKALESHPDKRPDDKNAAAEFDKIQKTYEVLGDEKARKAYDDLRKVQRARADRDAQKGAKRQKMMDDLKKREEAFVNERSAEEVAKMKLKAEIARVRQEGLARQKRQQEELAAAQNKARQSSNLSVSTPGGESTLLQGATLARTLKVSWDRTREGGLEDYGAEKLKTVFQKFGPVEDIIVKEDTKKKKKGSALVVMASEEGAALAIGAVCGDLSNPLLVKPAVPGLVPGQGGVTKPGYESERDGAAPGGVNGAMPGENVKKPPPGCVKDNPRDNPPGNVVGSGAGLERDQVNGVDGEYANASGRDGVNGANVETAPGGEDRKMPGGKKREAQEERRSDGAGMNGAASHVGAGTNGSQRPNIFANGPPRPLFGGGSGAPNNGAFSGAATAAVSGSHKDYENVTLMRMRQAAERARLIKELEERDAREAEAEKCV